MVTTLRREPTSDDERSARTAWIIVAVATVVCLLLTLYQTGDKSLWSDETFSIGTIDRPFGDALWRLANWEMNQSPYLLLLFGWFRLGQSEGFLNLLSAVFAVATVPMVFVAGRRLFDRRVGAAAAVLVAVHPMIVQWGQQLRAYSMLAFLTTALVIVFCRLVDRPTTGRAVAFALLGALASYTHFYALLTLLAMALSLLALPAVRRQAALRPLLLSGAILAVLLVPLAYYFLDREGDPLDWLAGQRQSILAPTARRLLGNGPTVAATYAVALLAAAWICLRLWRRTPPSTLAALDPHTDDLLRWRIVLTWSWLVVPFVVAAGVTVTIKPILETKYLIGIVPCVALLAGLTVASIPSRWWAGGLLTLLILASLRSDLAWYRVESVDDWRGATEVVSADGDVRVLPVPTREGTYGMGYYFDRNGLDRGLLLPAGESPAGLDEVWVVRRTASGLRAQDREVVEVLEAEFRPVEEIHLEGLDLTRWEAKG